MFKPPFYGLLRFFGRQEWIRPVIREKIIRMLVNPDTCGPFEFTVDFFGLKYSGNINRYLEWHVYFFGAYEKQELVFMSDAARKKGEKAVFLDIGANTGEYSLLLSRLCSKVHSFEPYDVIARQFNANVELNGIKNITLHEVGLGDRNETLDFFAPVNSHNTGTGTFVAGHEPGNNTLYKKLEIKNADEYIAGLGLDRIDLIKIDVEGFERRVLNGLKDTIKKYRPAIFMEYSESTAGTFASAEEFKDFLAGYRISRVTANKTVLFFFNKPCYGQKEYGFTKLPANLFLEPV
ncbi:MAG: FkbM family methyltransferase [Endomicrobiales bacterium]|nr:FkbM family methyltransferase [Endomicrobiales bacterium]